MRKHMHSKTQVRVTFKNVRHYFYYWLVYRFIKWGWFRHNGNYFKVGDLVTYNWKAKVQIPSVVKDKTEKSKLFIVTEVKNWPSGAASVFYRIEGTLEIRGSSSFWLKKI